MDNDTEVVEEVDTGQIDKEEVITEMAQISLYALTGVMDYQNLRVTAYKGTRTLQMPMDTGSIHNFLDYHLDMKLGCKVIQRVHMSVKVKVVGGTHVTCDSMVQNFELTMKSLVFVADVFLIPLGGCDVVLGVNWFNTLGKVQFDFIAHTIEFKWQGRHILLRGAVSNPLTIVDSKAMHKTLQVAGELSMMQVFALHKDDASDLYLGSMSLLLLLLILLVFRLCYIPFMMSF